MQRKILPILSLMLILALVLSACGAPAAAPEAPAAGGEAAARGVPNLQAVIQIGNDKMLWLLHHRGAAVVEQEAFDEIGKFFERCAPTS